MIIGIDASALSKKYPTGVENVSSQFIINLLKINSSATYRLYSPKALDLSLPSTCKYEVRVLPFKKYWHSFRLPVELKMNPPDKLLVPAYMVPKFAPKKTAVIIHDLAFKYFPHSYSRKDLFLQELAIKRAIKFAHRIIFVSKSTQKDFIKLFNYPTAQTAVITPSYIPLSQANKGNRFSNPYLLFIGRLESRKNVANIINAYNLFRSNTKRNEKLVLVGKPGYGHEDIMRSYENSPFKQDIHILGYVSDQELSNLYANASILLYPSLYEGFGLPILEAFTAKVPVITSNISSMPEIAGGAAITVDPNDVDTISRSIIQVLEDKPLQDKLIEDGLKQLNKFSWQESAEHLSQVLTEM